MAIIHPQEISTHAHFICEFVINIIIYHKPHKQLLKLDVTVFIMKILKASPFR